MKSIVAAVVGVLALAGIAHAQGAAAPAETGYIGFVAQSAFGNVTSQSFGVEGGVYVNPRLSIIAEAGLIRDTAPATLGSAAQVIAGYLAQTQSAVTYSVKQPISFGGVGVRYAIPYSETISPYVLGMGGFGRVKKDVAFTIGGTDLAGTATRPMGTFGGGVAWQPRPAVVLDLGYRYSRIATETTGTNVSRLGLTVGYRF
jgi:opacity protein-like surface antigen